MKKRQVGELAACSAALSVRTVRIERVNIAAPQSDEATVTAGVAAHQVRNTVAIEICRGQPKRLRKLFLKFRTRIVACGTRAVIVDVWQRNAITQIHGW